MTLWVINCDTVAGPVARLGVVVAVGVVPCYFPGACERKQRGCNNEKS